MEEMALSNSVSSAAGVLDQELFKPSALSSPELIDNDALALPLAGGNVQDVALYQVLNDLEPLAVLDGTDAKEDVPEIGAGIWAAVPAWLAGQEIEIGSPTSLWCKDGY